MKTKVIILIMSVLAITLSSCGNKETSTSTCVEAKQIIETAKEEMNALPVVHGDNMDYVNPVFIFGSNFGDFFLSMLRTQNYDMALKFTSKESIEKFGTEKIKGKYQNFKFNYNLKLTSKSQDNNSVTVLKFTTNEFATGKFKEMKVVTENDSCKLVLPDNLDDFLR